MNEEIYWKLTREVLATHFDANETPFLERELTVLRQKIFEVKFPELKARTFAPKAGDIPASAEQFSFKIYKTIGQAKTGSYDADDDDRIDVDSSEELGKIVPVTDSFSFTINELREAARNNVPLSELKPRMAKEAIERGVDKVLAFGGGGTGSANGLLNNSYIEGNTILSGQAWSTAGVPDPAKMLADLNLLAASVFTDSLQVFRTNQIILPSKQYILAEQTPYSAQLGDSVLTVFKRNNPGIEVEPWYQADGAGAGGLNRGMAYQKDPMVLEAIISQEFEALPPEVKAWRLITRCHARTGAIKFYQPKAAKYVDFIAAT